MYEINYIGFDGVDHQESYEGRLDYLLTYITHIEERGVHEISATNETVYAFGGLL